jgi:hypothetical protein
MTAHVIDIARYQLHSRCGCCCKVFGEKSVPNVSDTTEKFCAALPVRTGERCRFLL